MAKTIHTDKAPAAIGPYVQGKCGAISYLQVGKFRFHQKQVKLLEKPSKNKPNKC